MSLNNLIIPVVSAQAAQRDAQFILSSSPLHVMTTTRDSPDGELANLSDGGLGKPNRRTACVFLSPSFNRRALVKPMNDAWVHAWRSRR